MTVKNDETRLCRMLDSYVNPTIFYNTIESQDDDIATIDDRLQRMQDLLEQQRVLLESINKSLEESAKTDKELLNRLRNIDFK